jgi:hypothetical protein
MEKKRPEQLEVLKKMKGD